MAVLKCSLRWKRVHSEISEEGGFVRNQEESDMVSRYLHHPLRASGRHLKLRIYVIEANNVMTTRKSFPDPYFSIKLGFVPETTFKDKFVRKSSNPVFGELIEMDISLPTDDLLTISVFDKNRLRPDEYLGSTWISLEQRYYNTRHARCGVPFRYSPKTWRDHLSPRDLLDHLCAIYNLGKPQWLDNLTVEINST